MLRNDIWDELIDCDRITRYYKRRHRNFSRASNFVKLSIIFLGMGEVVLILQKLQIVSIIASVAIAVAVAMEFVFRFGEKSIILGITSTKSERLLDRIRSLWTEVEENYHYLDIHTEREELIRQKLITLREERTSLSELSSSQGISVNDRINKKCHEEAKKIAESYMYEDQ